MRRLERVRRKLLLGPHVVPDMMIATAKETVPLIQATSLQTRLLNLSITITDLNPIDTSTIVCFFSLWMFSVTRRSTSAISDMGLKYQQKRCSISTSYSQQCNLLYASARLLRKEHCLSTLCTHFVFTRSQHGAFSVFSQIQFQALSLHHT